MLGGPLPHVMAAKAMAFREILTPEYEAYAQQVVKNAQALAEGLLSEGAHLLTGGTDNHLLVMDVARSFDLTGRQAELLLREALMTVNRNSIPQDANGAWYTSGVRIGTPAVTTLGMKEKEMQALSKIIFALLKEAKAAPDPKTGKLSRAKTEIEPHLLQTFQEQIRNLLEDFPLYPELG